MSTKQLRQHRTAVVLTKDEFDSLKYCSEQTGYSASQLLLSSLEMMLAIGNGYRVAMERMTEAEKAQIYDIVIQTLKENPKDLDGFLRVYNQLELLGNLSYFWQESQKSKLEKQIKAHEKKQKTVNKAFEIIKKL